MMTEAAIDVGFFRDIYVALGDELDNGETGEIEKVVET